MWLVSGAPHVKKHILLWKTRKVYLIMLPPFPCPLRRSMQRDNNLLLFLVGAGQQGALAGGEVFESTHLYVQVRGWLP